MNMCKYVMVVAFSLAVLALTGCNNSNQPNGGTNGGTPSMSTNSTSTNMPAK